MLQDAGENNIHLEQDHVSDVMFPQPEAPIRFLL